MLVVGGRQPQPRRRLLGVHADPPAVICRDGGFMNVLETYPLFIFGDRSCAAGWFFLFCDASTNKQTGDRTKMFGVSCRSSCYIAPA